MVERLPWDYVVLQPLSDGKPSALKSIYNAVNVELRDGSIRLKLFNSSGKWGDRPDYTHEIRSTMSSLRKREMVKHLGKGRTGIYEITDAGQNYLKEIEP